VFWNALDRTITEPLVRAFKMIMLHVGAGCLS